MSIPGVSHERAVEAAGFGKWGRLKRPSLAKKGESMSLRLTSRRGRSLAAVCTGLALGSVSLNPAWAEGPRSNAVSFQTTATEEVTQDLMSVTLQVTRDGAQAAQVQAALKQVLETALAQAKRAAVPGGMDVRTGQFSVNPRYGN